MKAGFALGASLDNSVGIDDGRILNPEGLRYTDEFVRHKMLDAVGDLALAGAPLIGSYHSYCGGHKMNVAVLEALFSDRANYRFVESPRRRIAKASAPISAWSPRRLSCPSAAEPERRKLFNVETISSPLAIRPGGRLLLAGPKGVRSAESGSSRQNPQS